MIGMNVDASNLIAGRLSSKIAKKLINGENVVIVNAEKAIMVGRREEIVAKYKKKVDATVHSNPDFGPKYERIPSRILKRMIKGMLPNRKVTAERLMKQLKIYNGVPITLKDTKFDVMTEVANKDKHDFITLKEIAELIGGRW